jgi:4-hydroxy-tetrahydrodipicolinate synthase
MTHAIQGVHCAVATPVTAQGAPNLPLYAAHCRKLLDEGCHGLALLGTTGEANSFGRDTRMRLVDSVIEAGIPASCLLPGTSAPSVEDSLVLTRHAVQAGAKGVVMLPPYYYKGVTDEGLFRFYARVIEGVGDSRLRVVLYHIPQVSQIPLSHDLIRRLMAAFPGLVIGIKDSTGDPAHLQALCAIDGLGVLAGADPLLLPGLRAGGAGCITATSNLRADLLRQVWDHWADPARSAEIETWQEQIVAWRTLSSSSNQLPTIKTMLARSRGDDGWTWMMPPLVALDEAERQRVWAEMARLGG